MKLIRSAFAGALALALLVGLSLPAHAHAVPDLKKKAAVTVTFDLPQGLKSYGSLTLYRVGQIQEADGNYSFAPVAALAAGRFDFSDPGAPELAESLAAYLRAHPMLGVTKSAVWKDDTASVSFSQLELGLYLAVQSRAASGYEKMAPFLISLPYLSGGSYQYTLTAQAKSELEREPKPTQPPATKPTGRLPQTGQLTWPAGVLAAGGLILLGAGGALRRRKEESA